MLGALITRVIHGVSVEEVIFFINTIAILMLLVGVGYTQPLRIESTE